MSTNELADSLSAYSSKPVGDHKNDQVAANNVAKNGDAWDQFAQKYPLPDQKDMMTGDPLAEGKERLAKPEDREDRIIPAIGAYATKEYEARHARN